MAENNGIYFDEDTQLMLKAAEGDIKAYAELYKKYFPVVIGFVSKLNGQCHIAEDIAMEVFTRIWQQRTKYHPDSTVKTYLFSFTKNIIREYQRDTRHQDVEKDYPPLIDERSDPINIFQQKELTETIEKAKSKLSSKQLHAVELIFYSNISIAEAAKLAGCSESAFRRRVHDAKKRLSVLLQLIRIN